MIKAQLERLLLGKFSTENDRKDHIANFGQPKPVVVGKTRFYDKCLEQQRKLEALLKTVPEGVVVEHSIADGVVEFLLKEKPIGFSDQQAKELLNKLNAFVLENEVFSK